jgi:hypothetical protein
MTNQATIDDPKNEFLRESLAIMVRNHGPDDIVSTLASVLDDYAFEYARKTGDYDGASVMRLISDHLDGLEAFVDNYAPTME